MSGSCRSDPSRRGAGGCTCESSQYVSAARPPSRNTGDQAVIRSSSERARSSRFMADCARQAARGGAPASVCPCAARMNSATSRTAPAPPSRVVTYCACSRTVAGACGTVTAKPQAWNSGNVRQVVADVRAFLRAPSPAAGAAPPRRQACRRRRGTTCSIAQPPRAMGDRGRRAARDPRDRDARAPQEVDADAVERRERLHLVAVVVDVDAAVGEHAVDVAGQQADAARAREGVDRHQTILARNRSCRCSAPTRRSSASTTRSCETLGAASIVSTQSTASCSGRTVRGVPRHHVAHGDRGDVAHAVEAAPQVAVGEDAGDAPVGVDDRRHAHALAAHLDDRVGERRGDRRHRKRRAGAHDVADAREQAPPERAAGMRAREVLRGEPARVEQRQRERVAQRERGGRARRRREAQRAGLGVDRRVEVQVRGLRERALLVAGQRDELRALALQVRHEHHEFVGLAGVRQHDHDVVGRDHPEVAVRRLGRVHEERRRAGRRERGGQLARDVPGLADAGHDDAPAALEDQVDRRDERRPEPRGQRRDRARLRREDLARQREHARRVDAGLRGRAGDRVRDPTVHRASIAAARPRRSRAAAGSSLRRAGRGRA